MTPAEIEAKLAELLALPAETEWFEFKKADTDFNELGRYFSALSNEANLKSQPFGWLIFGVEDGTHKVLGTQYKPTRPSLDALKKSIADQTNNRTTFEEIYEVAHPDGRVIMFQIPPALPGMPTSWKGHFYGRENESLAALSVNEIEQIRRQTAEDWSAGICVGASLTDLDPKAIGFARQEYANKYPKLSNEVSAWDDATFLNKAKLTLRGEITRTAIILLGKSEAEHFISPAIARMTWILKDEHGIEQDYAHFSPPLILAVAQVFDRIRNLTYRYLPDASLFPTEVTQYDPWVIRETLHNCIAHQDYSMGGRINIVEEASDSLLFTNAGTFLPGSVPNVILRDAPSDVYPNRFLVEAMVNLNMIDTIGSGIKRMFGLQRKRFFPLPDYNLSEPNRVKVRIIGKVIDEKYSRMLKATPELDLWHVMALDKVQKKQPLTDDEFKALKNLRLLEGRRPNLFVSADVARATDSMVDYLNKRGIDKEYCRRMIVELLERQGRATKADFSSLLLNKLSDALDESQKVKFIANLLQELRAEGIVAPNGRGPSAFWELTKTEDKDAV